MLETARDSEEKLVYFLSLKLIPGGSEEIRLDCPTVTIGSPEQPFTITTMGPKFLASQLYQKSPIEVKKTRHISTVCLPFVYFVNFTPEFLNLSF